MTEATTTLMTDAAPTTQGAASQSSTDTAAAGTPTPGTTTSGEQSQQSTAGQTTQADAAKGEGAEGEQTQSDEKSGAPDKYEFVMPENVQMDDAGLAAFSEFAKDANLSQEDAQNLLNKMAPAMQARQAEAIKSLQSSWTEASKADKEFGGEKLSENLAVAKKAMETFGTPELRTLLNDTGLGNNPEIIRAFYRAGKAISEDRVVPPGTGSGPRGRSDPAKSLYPNQ